VIEFPCPHCGSTIRIQDTAAGKRGKCRNCGGSIQVPESEAITAETPPSEAVQASAETPQVDAHREKPQAFGWKEWFDEVMGFNYKTRRCPKCKTINEWERDRCIICNRVVIQTFLIQSLICSLLCPCFGTFVALPPALVVTLFIAMGKLDKARQASFLTMVCFWFAAGGTVLIYAVYGLFVLLFMNA